MEGIAGLDRIPWETRPMWALAFAFALVVAGPGVVRLLDLPTQIVRVDQVRSAGLGDVRDRAAPVEVDADADELVLDEHHGGSTVAGWGLTFRRDRNGHQTANNKEDPCTHFILPYRIRPPSRLTLRRSSLPLGRLPSAFISVYRRLPFPSTIPGG
jgi:hypothetical protein